MNKPHFPSFDAPPFEFSALGTVSIDALDDPSYEPSAFPGVAASQVSPAPAHITTQYQIIVKRNDNLFKVLNILNTMFSIIAVLLIAAIFAMVFYGLVTITEVAEMVSRVQEHNELQALSDK